MLASAIGGTFGIPTLDEAEERIMFGRCHQDPVAELVAAGDNHIIAKVPQVLDHAADDPLIGHIAYT